MRKPSRKSKAKATATRKAAKKGKPTGSTKSKRRTNSNRNAVEKLASLFDVYIGLAVEAKEIAKQTLGALGRCSISQSLLEKTTITALHEIESIRIDVGNLKELQSEIEAAAQRIEWTANAAERQQELLGRLSDLTKGSMEMVNYLHERDHYRDQCIASTKDLYELRKSLGLLDSNGQVIPGAKPKIE